MLSCYRLAALLSARDHRWRWRWRWRWPLALTLGLAGCTLFGSSSADWEIGRSPSGKSTQPVAETTLLYEVLADLYASDLATAGATLLVVQETLPVSKHKSMTFPQDYPAVHRYLGEVDKTCVASFVKANKQRYLLPTLAETPPYIEVTTISRINQLFHSGGWQTVMRAFPHAKAMISVARSGTCLGHKEALLYLMSTRGDGGGEGALVHGRVVDEHWQVVKKAVISQADSL